MNNGKQLSVRFTPSDLERIDAAVNDGHGMNTVDFIRSATREKLVELGIASVRSKTTQVVFGGGTA